MSARRPAVEDGKRGLADFTEEEMGAEMMIAAYQLVVRIWKE